MEEVDDEGVGVAGPVLAMDPPAEIMDSEEEFVQMTHAVEESAATAAEWYGPRRLA